MTSDDLLITYSSLGKYSVLVSCSQTITHLFSYPTEELFDVLQSIISAWLPESFHRYSRYISRTSQTTLKTRGVKTTA